MIKSIKKFINTVFYHSTSKDDTLVELENTKEALKTDIRDTFVFLDNYLKEKQIDSSIKKQLEIVMKQVGFKKHDIKLFVKDLINYIDELTRSIDDLDNLVERNYPDYLTDKTMTSKLSAISGTITNVTSTTMFLMDLGIYITYILDDSKLSKIKEKQIKQNIHAFAVIYTDYRGKIVNIVRDINKLSDTLVGNGEGFILSASINDKKFKLPVNGFIGNPIYHFRLWLVDLEMEKYEVLKDKKKLLELKLLDLKNKDIGNENPKLQQQIEYYEEKLAKVEYKISQIEED